MQGIDTEGANLTGSSHPHDCTAPSDELMHRICKSQCRRCVRSFGPRQDTAEWLHEADRSMTHSSLASIEVASCCCTAPPLSSSPRLLESTYRDHLQTGGPPCPLALALHPRRSSRSASSASRCTENASRKPAAHVSTKSATLL